MDCLDPADYNAHIEQMREAEYPMLKDSLYLDHAGTTLYSKWLMELFHADMMANLYGNPHSASPSSQRSTQEIENVRLQALKYFGADPEHFDLVFTSNTTSAIKLVMEAFREQERGFWYGYHVDSHTSLVGVREAAKEPRCFESDEAIEAWIEKTANQRAGERPRLLAYPAQSNMDGRRLPLEWSRRCRTRASSFPIYTLLDAAAMASTSPLQLEDVDSAPDFTVLSFSKVFGFPDLGALIVRKDVGHLFQRCRYFGGGTVDMVVCLKEQWHERKTGALHEQLEDGTLPIHSILALKCAMQAHNELFGSLDRIAHHTASLARQLYEGLVSLKHASGRNACVIYRVAKSEYGNPATQGPIIAFNLRDKKGSWVSNTEVEKLASIKDIHIRTGGLCNPGGIATALHLAPWEMRDNFSAGHRCGSENDVLNGKPTGVIRVSLGAMSCRKDVERFVDFIDEFFVDHTQPPIPNPSPLTTSISNHSPCLYIESLTVYPIKSCAGWHVPPSISWSVHREGLAWDREWCLVSQSTGAALSQKQHPRMALLHPSLDFTAGVLRISVAGRPDCLTVPLSRDPTYFATSAFASRPATVCGDPISAKVYTSPAIATYLSTALGTPCTLARYPSTSTAASRQSKPRHSPPRPLLLSNESPILTITRASLDALNVMLKSRPGGRAASSAVFRANVVLVGEQHSRAWAEDGWKGMRISHGGAEADPLDFAFLGGCRRCQMVCVNPETGQRGSEPFVTLAKTRRFGNGAGVLFGVHTALASGRASSGEAMVRVGDAVEVWEAEGDSDI